MQRKVIAHINFRWNNNLNPEVTKEPITAEEEKIIFQALQKHGNKWADIARLLRGRTDNVIKNHFYCTLRRQIRKILKGVKSKRTNESKEVSTEYIQKILKDYNLSYSALDNENVRDLLEHLDNEASSPSNCQSDHSLKTLPSPSHNPCRSLYCFV
eukprot:TRINITY_DN12956_c0_g2_i1.p2 TRINITY_DN12956_c0_g2~~TRINITY_DN12956_c0_g2_i1.p2  ORF type:complete len:156 (-),score=15.72 TRINITY_DN12956_c0_g2_i1:803-1270(-)